MDYDQFDEVCCKAEKWENKHLVDAMREKMEEVPKPWSEEDFRHNILSTLEKGDFRLIIAVDSLNDELKRIIQFLNSRGEDSPQIHALEMRQFETSDLQMLVPEVFGPTPPPIPEGVINEHIFIQKTSEICRQFYSRLKELAKREEFKTTSFTKHGYAFRHHKHGNLFVLYPYRLEMWFGPGYPDDFLDRETDKEFWSRISQIQAFGSKMDKKNPVVVVDDRTWTEEDVNTFVGAVELLGSRLESPRM